MGTLTILVIPPNIVYAERARIVVLVPQKSCRLLRIYMVSTIQVRMERVWWIYF
jgi:hypothetical protein